MAPALHCTDILGKPQGGGTGTSPASQPSPPVLLTTSVLGPLLVLQVLPPFSLIVDMPLVAAQSQDLVLLEGWEGQVVLQAMYRHLVMLPAGGMMGTCGG